MLGYLNISVCYMPIYPFNLSFIILLIKTLHFLTFCQYVCFYVGTPWDSGRKKSQDHVCCMVQCDWVKKFLSCYKVMSYSSKCCRKDRKKLWRCITLYWGGAYNLSFKMGHIWVWSWCCGLHTGNRHTVEQVISYACPRPEALDFPSESSVGRSFTCILTLMLADCRFLGCGSSSLWMHSLWSTLRILLAEA